MTVAVRAALLPHPPLLLPELAGGAASELDPLRAACHKAVDAVLTASGALVVIGDGPVWGIATRAAAASFTPYGADVEVQLPPVHLGVDLPGFPEPHHFDELPLSLAVAAWLLMPPTGGPTGIPAGGGPSRVDELAPGGDEGAAAAEGDGAAATGGGVPPLLACTVPATLGPGAAAAIGGALVEAAADRGPVGVIAMADLSARRGAAAPGAFHPAATAFDAEVARAVAAGDLAALAALDPAEAAELQVGGRAVLQALAGAMRGGAPPAGQVLYDEAPYGVGYLVGILDRPAAGAPPGGRAR